MDEDRAERVSEIKRRISRASTRSTRGVVADAISAPAAGVRLASAVRRNARIRKGRRTRR